MFQTLQRKMAEMHQKNKYEIQIIHQKNEEETQILREQNEEAPKAWTTGQKTNFLEEIWGHTEWGEDIYFEDQSILVNSSRRDSCIVETQPFGTHCYFGRRAQGTHIYWSYCGGTTFTTWKWLNIDWYDKSMDLDEQVDVYTTQMSLYISNNSVLCRVFPTSLKGGGVLSWFTRLPPNLVDCFKALLSKFDTQFTTSRPHHLTSISLANIW